MSMSELHKPEWYGECAIISDKYNDYVQIKYKCNGTGTLYDYSLFPGINLIFMDFNNRSKNSLTSIWTPLKKWS